MAGVISYFDGLEGNLCQKINRLSRRENVRRFFEIVSKAGDGGFWVAMGGIVMLVEGGAALPAVGRIAATALVGVLLYKLLKNNLVRERPYINHDNMLCGTAPLDRYSFPSGHTLHAVSLSIMLVHYMPALAWIVIPFAVLVAASRVILGLHYPSDVIVGALLGTGLALTAISI